MPSATSCAFLPLFLFLSRKSLAGSGGKPSSQDYESLPFRFYLPSVFPVLTLLAVREYLLTHFLLPPQCKSPPGAHAYRHDYALPRPPASAVIPHFPSLPLLLGNVSLLKPLSAPPPPRHSRNWIVWIDLFSPHISSPFRRLFFVPSIFQWVEIFPARDLRSISA